MTRVERKQQVKPEREAMGAFIASCSFSLVFLILALSAAIVAASMAAAAIVAASMDAS